MGDITLLLQRAQTGEKQAYDLLFTRVYAELGKLARAKLARESSIAHLDATTLLHEAYLRLSAGTELPARDRNAFFAYASSAMRSVIVDHVRNRSAQKRGYGEREITLVTQDAEALAEPDIDALDLAMDELKAIDQRCHDIVEMRYFGGLSIEEIAEILTISPATVKRDWQKARAFLFKAITD